MGNHTSGNRLNNRATRREKTPLNGLRAKRVELGFSQLDVAGPLDMTKAHYSKIERGEVSLFLCDAIQLSVLLSLDVKQFY